MTGTELKGFVRDSNFTIKQLSDWLEMEAEQITNLFKLGKQRLPISVIGRLRPVLEQYDNMGR